MAAEYKMGYGPVMTYGGWLGLMFVVTGLAGCDDHGDAVDEGGAGTMHQGGADQAGGTDTSPTAGVANVGATGGTDTAGAGTGGTDTASAGTGGTDTAGAGTGGTSMAGTSSLCTVTPGAEDEGARTPPGLPCGRMGATDSASGLLLDVGHVRPIVGLTKSGERLVSTDDAGRWVLWDLEKHLLLARGTHYPTVRPKVAGETLLVTVPIEEIGHELPGLYRNALQVRSAVDGSLRSPDGFTNVTPFGVATDGSYVWAATDRTIQAWSPDGMLLASADGDYAGADVFAAPDELDIALGSAGANVIEKLEIDTGDSSTFAIQGAFYAWFTDGVRFMTHVSNTVRLYSTVGATQEAIFPVPTLQTLTGRGDYFWIGKTFYSVFDPTIPIPIANDRSFTTQTFDSNGGPVALMGVFSANDDARDDSVAIVTLTSSGPELSEFSVPELTEFPRIEESASSIAYLAADADGWAWGGDSGQVFDGAALDRPLSCGAISSIATARNGRTAVATAAGGVLLFEASGQAPQFLGQVDQDHSPSTVAISSDGSLLVVVSLPFPGLSSVRPLLRAFNLPEMTLAKEWPGGGFEVSMSSSGTRFVERMSIPNTSQTNYQLVDLDQTPILTVRSLSSFRHGQAYLSPNGSVVAIPTTEQTRPDATADIYQDGELVGALQGAPLGFLDQTRLLANASGHASVFDTSGVLQPGQILPVLSGVTPLPADQVYSTDPNAIYSLGSAEELWSCPRATLGSAGGGYVMFQPASAPHQVIAAPYPVQ